jgi:hypothetical protein
MALHFALQIREVVCIGDATKLEDRTAMVGASRAEYAGRSHRPGAGSVFALASQLLSL